MHQAKRIAGRFIDLARADGKCLTHAQTARLVYIAHGWCLGLFGRALIEDRVYALAAGPIIISLHHIDNGPVVADPELSRLSEAGGFEAWETGLIEAVYACYRTFSGYQLSLLTASEDTPWARVWDKGAGNSSTIPDQLIQRHYAGMARQRAGFPVVA